MKKLCALVLALVMTLGLATVSTNAAFEGESFNFNEAVDVMAAVGVFKGDENGKFNPSNSLDRASAAKLIAYLDLGEKVAEALPQAQAFSDVPANHWASKYIAYCAQSGYVSGYDGKFFPAGELNGYAFGKMILCVLGYDAEIEGLTGTTTWSISAAKLMESNDITDGVDTNASLTLTREQAAQYCLNALQATMVEYADKGTSIDIGGTKITTGAKKASAVVSTAAYKGSIIDEGAAPYYLQLGEKLYKGDLVKTAPTDAMRRPATKWAYETSTICTVADAPDLSLVADKTGKTYKQLIAAKDASLDYTNSATCLIVNGSNTGADVTTVAKLGDVIEIYLNSTTKKIDTVAVTQYSVAKITADVGTKTEDGVLKVRVPGVVNAYTDKSYVYGYDGLAKDDIVYYYQALNNGGTASYYLAKAESFTGKTTASKAASGSTPAKYTIGGEAYSINENITTVAGLLTSGTAAVVYNTEYEFWKDANGYIIYGSAVETSSSDYVVLKEIGIVTSSGVSTSAYVEGRIVKMDGTSEVVRISEIKDATGHTLTGSAASDTAYGADGTLINTSGASALTTAATKCARNQMYTYTVSDSKYKLAAVSGTNLVTDGYSTINTTYGTNAGSAATITVTNKSSATTTRVLTVNDNTVFVVSTTKDYSDSDNNFKVYTGKAAVPTVTAAKEYAYVTKSGVATYVYLDGYTSSIMPDENGIYFLTAANVGTFHNDEDEDGESFYYRDVEAIVDGEYTTVKVKNDSTGAASTTGAIAAYNYGTVAYDDNGCVDTFNRIDARDMAKGEGYSYADGTLSVTSPTASYSALNDTALFYENEDGDVIKSTMSAYAEDDNDEIYVVLTKDTDDKFVDFAYVKYVDDATTPTISAIAIANGNLTSATETTDDTLYTLTGSAGQYATLTVTLPAGAKISSVSTSATDHFTAAVASDTTITLTYVLTGSTADTLTITTVAPDGGTTTTKTVTIKTATAG